MRKSWIAIAIIALFAGLIVAYRADRPGNPPSESAPASRGPETPPDVPAARGSTPSSPQPEPNAPETPRGEPAGRTGAGGDDGPTSKPREVTSLSAAPVMRGQSPPELPHGDAVPSPVASPVPPPVLPETTAEAPKAESSKEKGTPVPVDDPESDRHAPVLQYLRFDPPEIKDGGVAMLSVDSTDDLSGVQSVSGALRSPSEAAIVPFVAHDPTGGGVFSATIAIPRQAETGEWFVAVLQIVDKAGNSLNLTFARTTIPQGGVLRVTSEESDATAPVVHGVTLDKRTVGAGERNRIAVEIDDDRSGVATVAGSFQSPSKSAFIPFVCNPSGEPSSWVGDVPVPADADCGEWTLRQLRVADKANNTAFLAVDSPEVGHVSFVVSGGGGCDSEPPVIDTFYFAPMAVSNTTATDITLTVRAHDDGSGVGSLTGRVEGPVSATGQVPSIYFECTPNPKDPDAPMTARISVPQYAAKGLWKVSLVQVMDKARNSRSYGRDDPALSDGYFTVE